MKRFLIVTWLIMSFVLWADGPEYNDIELAKSSITNCSDGIKQTWNYKPYGTIFHGTNIDLGCLEDMNGIPSYQNPGDALILKGYNFWFFIDSNSYGTSIEDEDYGIVVQHGHGTWTGNYLIKGVLSAKS